MTDYGYLEINYGFTQETGLTKIVGVTVRGNSRLFIISHQVLCRSRLGEIGNGEKVIIGDCKFRVVGRQEEPPFNLIATVDDNFYLVFKAYYQLNRFLNSFRGRLLLTLAIWGLAEYRPGIRIWWTDIYIIRWIGRIYNRIRWWTT